MSNWIQHGSGSNLVNYLANYVKERNIEKMSRFGRNLKHWGVKLEENELKFSNSGSECVWIPAAFFEGEKCKVYEGVCLLPKLVSVSSQSGGQEGGGSGGGRGQGKGGGGDRGGRGQGRGGGDGSRCNFGRSIQFTEVIVIF